MKLIVRLLNLRLLNLIAECEADYEADCVVKCEAEWEAAERELLNGRLNVGLNGWLMGG